MSVRAIDHLPACVTRVRAIIWPDARGRILRTPYANRVVQSHAAVTAKKKGAILAGHDRGKNSYEMEEENAQEDAQD